MLSAAHILHMPAALELCREFLVKVEQYDLACKQTAALTFIFKPVATRKPLPCMLKKNDSVHVSHNVILRSSESLFKSVASGTATEPEELCVASTSALEQLPKPPTVQISVVEAAKDDDSKAGRVILDVACCDGPVRFHRVLNDEYGTEIVSTSDRGDCDSDDENTMDLDEVSGHPDIILVFIYFDSFEDRT